MIEVWLPIKDFEEFYEINNKGDVRSKDRKCDKGRTSKGKIIKQWKNHKGYPMVTLSAHGIKKHFAVHRLVAISFLKNQNNLPCVNHKDCNPLNNDAKNLEWCNYQYNNTYNDRHLCRSKIIAQIENGNIVASYKSIREAERQTGICLAGIIKCAKGQINHAGGYQWKYL